LKIIVLGDEDTVAGFKLAGVNEGYVVKTSREVEEVVTKALKDEEVAIIVATEEAIDLAPQAFQSIYTRPRPAIVEIPTKMGSKRKVDPIRELIRRAIGVEVRV